MVILKAWTSASMVAFHVDWVKLVHNLLELVAESKTAAKELYRDAKSLSGARERQVDLW